MHLILRFTIAAAALGAAALFSRAACAQQDPRVEALEKLRLWSATTRTKECEDMREDILLRAGECPGEAAFAEAIDCVTTANPETLKPAHERCLAPGERSRAKLDRIRAERKVRDAMAAREAALLATLGPLPLLEPLEKRECRAFSRGGVFVAAAIADGFAECAGEIERSARVALCEPGAGAAAEPAAEEVHYVFQRGALAPWWKTLSCDRSSGSGRARDEPVHEAAGQPLPLP